MSSSHHHAARPLKLFDTMKRRYLYRHVRNRCQLRLRCMPMNRQRADQLFA
jgi:hypothetical protein